MPRITRSTVNSSKNTKEETTSPSKKRKTVKEDNKPKSLKNNRIEDAQYETRKRKATVSRSKSVPAEKQEKNTRNLRSKENIEENDLTTQEDETPPKRSRKLIAEKFQETKAKFTASKKKTKEVASKTKPKNENDDKQNQKKKKLKNEADSDDEFVQKRPTKSKFGRKRKIVIPEDNSEDFIDDYKPDSDENIESDVSVPSDTVSESDNDYGDDKIKKKKSRYQATKSKGKTGTKANFTTKKNQSKKEENFQKVFATLAWPHLKYEFLQPDKITDKEGHGLNHPDYNPKTLYVPEAFLNTQTPSMRQWWVFKSEHFDCVLFYKLGNMYILNHMDGVVGANELHLNFLRLPVFMREGYAMVCFMEANCGSYSSILIEKGYKVARIEQTETVEKMNERLRKKQKQSKFEKVLRRELCQKSSKGIRIYTAQDSNDPDPASRYLLAIVEKHTSRENVSTFGVCFIDTTIGDFYLGQFEDDRSSSRLLTLIAHYPPAHIIYERGNLSHSTLLLINKLRHTVTKEALIKDTQFWSAAKVLKHLQNEKYFKNKDDLNFSWPQSLEFCLNKDTSSNFTPNTEKELAIKALGGVVSILKEYMLDHYILALCRFMIYTPVELITDVKSVHKTRFAQNMVLDAMAINNLRIFGSDGSLLKTLDNCCTFFGKRLLRDWICRPSCRKAIITERQEAVSEFLSRVNIVNEIRKKLGSLPDLPRLLNKIHAQGNSKVAGDHPDSRAIMYDNKVYTVRTVTDFIFVLYGLKEVFYIIELLEGFSTPIIQRISKIESDDGSFNFKETLDHFINGFDHEEAMQEGYILPEPGMDKDYDEALLKLLSIEQELDAYLEKQRKHFGVEVKFCGKESKRFQIEIPESHSDKATDKYDLQGSRKGFKRYYTREARDLLVKQICAEKEKSQILEDSNKRVLAKFSEHYDEWSRAVANVAILDCLLSLVQYSRSCETSVPVVNDDLDNEDISLEICDGRHPYLKIKNFTPNDTSIGTKSIKESAPLMLLTGLNMGGKSTLMRQVGLITIMAQMGSRVPAKSCKLTLVDRIFTRLGANDDIMAGQSTFLVELTETSAILQHATRYSLVLLDELGRGTSTYDGTAIANSVVDALTKMKCRTLFSTHYHSLVEDYRDNKNVIIAHMACKVNADRENEITEENVVFLYKLKKGICPKSYGFNVARLAGIPTKITKRAYEIATKLESEVNLRHAFTTFFSAKKETSIKSLLQKGISIMKKN